MGRFDDSSWPSAKRGRIIMTKPNRPFVIDHSALDDLLLGEGRF